MPSKISWRGPYIVLTGIAFVLMFWSIFLPETPRWLIKNGFHEEGLATLADLHGDGDINDKVIEATYREIAAAIELENMETENAPGWLQMFTRYGRRTFMAITSQMFAQLNGINVSHLPLHYFISVLIYEIGHSLFPPRQPFACRIRHFSITSVHWSL
jgi:MFS family permease